MDRHEVTAADQMKKACRSVDPVTSAITIAALFLMQDEQPRRFAGDAGFTGTLVRQYRLPSGIARGRTYDRKRDKDVGWFKSLPLRVTAYMGRDLIAAYTPWLVHVRKADQRLREKEDQINRDLARAFGTEEAA